MRKRKKRKENEVGGPGKMALIRMAEGMMEIPSELKMKGQKCPRTTGMNSRIRIYLLLHSAIPFVFAHNSLHYHHTICISIYLYIFFK